VSLGVPRRVQAGVAAGLAAACLALASASASAAASSVRGQEWWLAALHVTQAQQSTRGAGVTVAVLDTGVYPDQADLKGAVVTGPDYTSSGRTAGGSFWGINGTAMASLIAGRGHGRGHAAGILGVAPAATILSVRVTLEGDDPLLADASVAARLPGAIAHGIRYAVAHHATVIDLPLDPVTAAGAPGAGGSAAERAAVAYALAHHVVLVAPAGDEGDGTDPVNFPAAYHGVISVGAFNSAFTKAPFSSRQPYVTLTAAGDAVIAASGPKGYAVVSSTAAASAVVTGIVALIRAQFPSLSPAQVTQALTGSTVFRPPGGQQDGSGAGTVDAAKALAAAARMTEAVSPGSSPASALPPSAPAAHASSGLRNTLLLDVGIAVALFLLLAVPILGYGSYRRRRARAARLAEVRAAAQPVPRQSPAMAAAGAATRHAAIDTPEPEPYSYTPAPASEEPTDVIAPYTNATRAGARPPWGAWDSPTGPLDAGPSGSGPSGSGPSGSGSSGSGSPVGGSSAGGLPGTDLPGRGPGRSSPPGNGPLGSDPLSGGRPGSDRLGSAPPGGFRGSSFSGRALPGTDDRPALPRRALRADEDGRAAYGGLPRAGSDRAGPGLVGPVFAGPADGGGAAARSTPGDNTAGGGVPGGPAPDQDIGSGTDPASPGTVGGGLMASHRTGGPRSPKVSGSPPWEPAPEPPGEVPWGRSAMPPAMGARAFPASPPQPGQAPPPGPPPPRQPDHEQSSWDAIAEEAWPGGPTTSRPPSSQRPSGNRARGRRSASGSDRYDNDDDPATTSQPIYVWNPHVTTVNLPAVESGEDHRGENRRRLWNRRGEPG
jgi:hypothetical protein